MKKIFTIVLLLGSLIANGQGDTTHFFRTLPDSTAIGINDGDPVTKEIGAPGGTIVSGDGKVELVFPDGALEKNAMITIQPTTNLAPNGAGKSYRFEPSGIQFRKPVEIVFHYTDQEARTCPPDLMVLGIQNNDGKWSFVQYESFDSVSKTLKGFINHFSSASNLYTLKLDAEKKELPVNGSTNLHIWKIPTVEVTIGPIVDAATGQPLPGDPDGVEVHVGDIIFQNEFKLNQFVLWYVNGVELGNSLNGYLTVSEETSKISHSMTSMAKYTAPNNLPPTNPVTVSVDVYVSYHGPKVFRRTRSLSCQIEIYDGYEVKIEGVTDYSSFLCGNKLTDEGSFNVRLDANGGSVKDIQNNMMKLPVRMANCPCTITWLNEATCVGPIDIAGIKTIKVTPPNPPLQPNSLVQIEFIPATAVYPSIKTSCKKAKDMTVPPTFGPAVPIYIEFYTKSEVQTLTPFKTPNTEFKITIRPLRHD